MPETRRLLLRRFRPSDLPALAEIHADPKVMETLGALLDRAASDALVARFEAAFEDHGFGFYCVEVKGGPSCIGFVGLSVPTFEAPFQPCVEIGWRIASREWGKGFAPEAAEAVLEDAFGTLGLDEVLSFTAVTNLRSRRVMEKLGFHRDPGEDFDHPRVPEGDPLRRHVLYRLSAFSWRDRRRADTP